MLLEMALVKALMDFPHDPEADAMHKCMAENLIYEAADQGVIGQRLVMEVMLNRLEAGYTPEDVCGMVYAPYQFSWTSTPQEKRRAYTEAEMLQAYQVVYSYLYQDEDQVEYLLPRNTKHYLNVVSAKDLSWYDPDKVVYEYKDHQFLVLD